jgi:uncharacterized ParB-like nuclease family protein
MTERVWRVGHEYRDRGGVKFADDELLNWLVTPAGSIANSGGIRFKDPVGNVVVDAESGKNIPAYIVLFTRDMTAQHHNPWDDVVDEMSGNIQYWGDAKHSTRSKFYYQFKGNARLEAVNNLRLSGRTGEMRSDPPFLEKAVRLSQIQRPLCPVRPAARVV